MEKKKKEQKGPPPIKILVRGLLRGGGKKNSSLQTETHYGGETVLTRKTKKATREQVELKKKPWGNKA